MAEEIWDSMLAISGELTGSGGILETRYRGGDSREW